MSFERRMTEAQAYELGKAAGAELVALARSLVIDGTSCQVLLNGDYVSPSWRACPNGERVFQADYSGWGLSEAYAEGLDEVTEAYELNGESLSWYDGALWLCPEGMSPDQGEEA